MRSEAAYDSETVADRYNSFGYTRVGSEHIVESTYTFGLGIVRRCIQHFTVP